MGNPDGHGLNRFLIILTRITHSHCHCPVYPGNPESQTHAFGCHMDYPDKTGNDTVEGWKRVNQIKKWSKDKDKVSIFRCYQA